jgi:hypothetical protein
MPDETVVGEVPQAEKGAPPASRRRFSIPMIVAAVIMFLAMASYFFYGLLFLLVGLGAIIDQSAGVAANSALVTVERLNLVLAGLYLFFGVLALVVLAGFLLKRRRAWSAAMTWTALSLAVNLVSYSKGEPRYLSMLACVVLLLVLNQASVHREFRLEGR